MPTTLLARLRIRRDTYANLYATNRVYGRGEPVYDETNDKLKVGDGITAWRDIDYMDADAAVAALKDVQLNLGTLADGQALVYNASLQKWVNSTAGGSPSGAAGGDLSGNYPNPTVATGAIGTSKLGGDITAAGKALLDDVDNIAQRTTLGLGTVATQDANAVALTGGTISGVNVVTGTYQSPANEALMKIVRKASAGTITKGQVVYIVGSQGTHLTVELADADSELTAATTIGVAAETITNTVSGYIITQGLLTGLSNLPTGTFVNGNALWLSQTAGGWTTTKPVQPAHLVFLGWVQDASNGAAGRAYVKVINGQELDELHDVLIGASPADNDLLAYDLPSGLWKNQTAAEAGLAASSHTHGNITNAGAIGSTASLPIITGAGGVLQAGSFGSTTGTFCEGNDSRLSDARTPTGSAGGSLTGTYPNPTINSAAVTSAMLRNSTALSVIGRSANTAGVPADIAATVDGQVLRLSGTTLGFGTIATAGIGDSQITYAKIQNVTTARILGRTAAGAGVVEELSAGANLSLSAGTLAVTASGSTTQVQFNNGGALGGHSGLTYNSGTSELTVAGDLAVNGGDITSSSSNFNLAATSTDVRIAAGAATAPTIRLGTNITGNTVTLNGIAAGTSNLDVNVTTGIVNLFTGITTGTLNMATGGASTINLGGASASVNIGTTAGNSTLTIQANSGLGVATLATTAGVTTGNLFNTAVTNLNIGGAATTLTLGATTGTAALRNPALRLGNTTSSITTNSGTANSLTLAPFGSLTIAPTTSATSLGGTQAQLQVTNAVDGAGQVRVTGGNLYLGTYSTDGLSSLDAGILFEGATANSFTTRLQAADPGANRTITLPNASGTVGLVAGSTNQVQYNSSGSLAASSAFTFDGSHLQVGSQGQVRLGSSGATYVALRSPATVTNSNIYTLPDVVGSNGQVLQIASVSGNDATLQWATVSGGGGGAPTTVDYLVRTADATLTNERVVANSNTVSANWVTAGQVSFERAALSGDVTAGVNSNTTTIADNAVTFAKFQDIATDRLLGRSSAGAGDVQEIVCTAAGRNLLDDADAAAQRTTLGLGTTDTPKFARIILENDEVIRNNTNGRIDFMPAPSASDRFGLYADVSSWAFGVRMGIVRSSDDVINPANRFIRYECRLAVATDQPISVHESDWFSVGSSSAGNDTMQIGVFANPSFDTSGALVLCNISSRGAANRSPSTKHVDPTFYVYSSDGNEPNDFVRMSHNQTDGVIETGAGDLNLVSASGNINNNGNRIPKVFYGSSAPNPLTGDQGDLYFKY